MSELWTPEEVRLHIDTSLEEEALQNVIDGESAFLASRIGPLTGERVETFYTTANTRALPIMLRRPTDAVEVTDDAAAVDVVLAAGRRVVRDPDWLYRWLGTVEVTYTPNDRVAVRSALLELVRIALTETGYAAETTDSLAYRNDAGARWARRESLVRSLGAPRLPVSMRLVSSVAP